MNKLIRFIRFRFREFSTMISIDEISFLCHVDSLNVALSFEEQLIDLSQALSLEDHVTTPDSDDDETILEEEVRPPSPTKRDRAASEDFWDADHVPREWVATPKSPAKRARAVYRCTKCGQPKRGHLCPYD